MGGVDLGDQYRGYYQVRIKSRKFYKYIFWFLFEICILNSSILHRYSPYIGRNLTYLEYRIELAQQLIGNYCSRKRPGRQPSTLAPAPKRISVEYFPARTTKGRCSYCKDIGARHGIATTVIRGYVTLDFATQTASLLNAWSYVTHRASLI